MQTNAIQCNTMQYNAIQCNTMQCIAMQYNAKHAMNTIQYMSQSFKQLPANLEQWNFSTMKCKNFNAME